MFVYDFCVRRKKQRTVIYFSGLLVSVVDVVIIDIWWLVFNVFSVKESWMYSLLNVLACCLTTKAITENRHIFCPLESVRSENSSYFAESKYKLFISRYYHSWRHYSQLTDFPSGNLTQFIIFSILILVRLPIKAVLIYYKNSFLWQIVKPSWVSCWFWEALCRFNVW